jgi:hypothetical protein
VIAGPFIAGLPRRSVFLCRRPSSGTARDARAHGPVEGHACLDKLVEGTVCKILAEQEVKPHKVRYYLEASFQACALRPAPHPRCIQTGA